ncbi:hypothetical protein [Mycetocola saprophilus]|uniref:hypothetical protein n=1 Tax=Mycetocola saprophilus TaxID=76636 RepID=UPI003BF17217
MSSRPLTVGLLFIGSSLAAYALPESFPARELIAAALFSGALLGTAGSRYFRQALFGSRRTGVIATRALAIWSLGAAVLGSTSWAQPDANPWGSLLTISMLGNLVLTLIIVVDIARAPHLSVPWKRIPLAMLMLQALAYLASTLLIRMNAEPVGIQIVTAAVSLIAAATPLSYGILLLSLTRTDHRDGATEPTGRGQVVSDAAGTPG